MPQIVLTFLSEAKRQLLFEAYPLVISLLDDRIDPQVFLEDFRKNRETLIRQNILTSGEADKLEQLAGSKILDSLGKKTNPDIIRRWESIREKSHTNLKQVLSKIGMDVPEFEAAINAEVNSIRDYVTASIYFRGHYPLVEILKGKGYTVFSEPGLLKRIKYWMLNSGSSETRTQKKMGINPKGVGKFKEPYIIYGAMFLENKRDFSSIYGKSLFLLRKDSIKNRTTFTYGDSVAKSGRGLGWSADYPLVWDDAVIARAAMNINGDYNNNYIEAQIMGGVTAKDIEEIRISQGDISHWKQLLYPNGNKIVEIIDEGRKKFPWIKFKIYK